MIKVTFEDLMYAGFCPLRPDLITRELISTKLTLQYFEILNSSSVTVSPADNRYCSYSPLVDFRSTQSSLALLGLPAMTHASSGFTQRGEV